MQNAKYKMNRIQNTNFNLYFVFCTLNLSCMLHFIFCGFLHIHAAVNLDYLAGNIA